MTSQFIEKFIQYQTPVPNSSIYTLQEVKKDLKLLLQLATISQLNRKTEKDGNIIFFCKKCGKECFLITVTETYEYGDQPSRNQQPRYKIKDDFNIMRHAKSCQFQGEQAIYFKTYCLMQLKKDVIQDFMVKKRLMKKQPSQILYLFSNHGIKRGVQQPQRPRYFFESFIKTNQFRKSLKKKFDNIVNIDIKAKQNKRKVKIEEPIQLSQDQQFRLLQTPKEKRKAANKENLLSQFTRIKTQQKSEPNVASLKFQLQSSQNKVSKEQPSDIFFQEEYPEKHSNRPFEYAQHQHFSFNFSEIYDQKKQKIQGWFEEQQQKQNKQKNRQKNSIGIDSFENAFPVSRQHFDIDWNKWDSLANLIEDAHQKEIN